MPRLAPHNPKNRFEVYRFFNGLSEEGKEGLDRRRTRVSFHTLRHTYASWAVMEGVPLYVVGKAIGHKTTVMNQRFSHLAPESHRAAFEAVARGRQESTGPDKIGARREDTG